MSGTAKVALLSHDSGLLAHWKKAFGSSNVSCIGRIFDLEAGVTPSVESIWVDCGMPSLPAWTDPFWKPIFHRTRIICASSKPQNAEGIEALDAGCSAFCHAFADLKTLQQVAEVVSAGQVWVGRDLMQLLLSGARRAGMQQSKPMTQWATPLTQREQEIAILAANGASNKVIAANCGITERTVKAHLAAIFEKLNLTDRLQLALKVHGIN